MKYYFLFLVKIYKNITYILCLDAHVNVDELMDTTPTKLQKRSTTQMVELFQGMYS